MFNILTAELLLSSRALFIVAAEHCVAVTAEINSCDRNIIKRKSEYMRLNSQSCWDKILKKSVVAENRNPFAE